jgi:hypothetical protein
MGFGRDYVNMTLHADDETGALGDAQHRLAEALDRLSDQQAAD